MKTLKGNDGQIYVLADGNVVNTNSGGYWYDNNTSSIISIESMYMQAQNKDTTHDYVTDAILSSLYYHDYNYESSLDIATNKWYWLFGNPVDGGLAFAYTSADHAQFISFNPNSGYYGSEPIHRNATMMILDVVYMGGNNYDNYSAYQISRMSQNNENLGFEASTYWFDLGHLSMQTATTYLQELPLCDPHTPIEALTEPYYVPEGVAVFSGYDNGVGFVHDEQTYGYFLNPFTTWNYGTVARWMDEVPEYDPTQDDPYAGGGYNDTDGGGGIPRQSEDVDFPDLPPSLLLSSGIVKMYAPNSNEMNQFINYIYSAPDDIVTNFKKIWVNPMDSIISLSLVPFTVPVQGAEEIVKFCGVSSGVYMHPLASQYITKDCGTIHLREEYKSLLDYNSYSKIKCFLPFFGFVDLNTDDVMDADIHIKYNIDLLTGEALAIIKCTKQNDKYHIRYNSCLYQFKGNVLTQAPLTGNNYQQLYNGVLNLVTAVALPNPASVAGVASDIMSQKVTVQRGGSITGNGGALGEYTPYLLVECPVTSISDSEQRKYIGYPHNKVYQLKELDGYTEIDIDSFRIKDIDNITNEEAQELLDIMSSGVEFNKSVR